MSLRTTPICRLTAAFACALTVGGLRAELIKVSPFLPPQSANAPTQNAPLAFAGIMELDEVQQYRIVVADPTKKIGTWLKLGERDANLGVVMKAFHPENETVEVEYGGQTMTLPLKSSKVMSSGVASAVVPPPPPMPNVSPAVLQSVRIDPSQADEQRRLEAVAAEVARRRALREQAAQQNQPGAVPGAPQPVTPQQPNVTRQDIQQAQQMQPQRGIRRQ